MKDHRSNGQKYASVSAAVTKRAALYLRVSSDKQEKEETIESQETNCRAYCKERGYIIVAVYRDTWTGMEYRHRPELNKLLKAAENREFDVVVFNSLERFSRKLAHQVILTELLAEHDVTIESVTEVLGDSSPLGQIFNSVISAAGEIEWMRLKERTDRGKQKRLVEEKKMRGSGPARYGFKWNEDKSKYLVNDDIVWKDADGKEWSEADIARRIIYMVRDGLPLRRVAFILTEEGVPKRNGDPIWGPNTICDMIWDDAYAGIAIQNKMRVERLPEGKRRVTDRPPEEHIILPEGTIPPLVDMSVLEEARRQLAHNKEVAARRNKNPEDTLLRCGLVVCGICNSNMFVSRGGRRRDDGSEKIRYMCRTTNSLGLKIHFIPELERHYLSIVTRIADEAAWKRAQEIINDPDEVKRHVEAKRKQMGENPTEKPLAVVENTIAKLKQTAKNLERQITRLSEKTPEDDDEAQEIDTTIDSLRQQKAVLNKQIKDQEKEREKLRSEQDYWLIMQQAIETFEEWCNEWRDKLEQAGYEEKRYILEFLSIRVKVYKHGHKPPYEVESEPLLNCVPNHL